MPRNEHKVRVCVHYAIHTIIILQLSSHSEMHLIGVWHEIWSICILLLTIVESSFHIMRIMVHTNQE